MLPNFKSVCVAVPEKVLIEKQIFIKSTYFTARIKIVIRRDGKSPDCKPIWRSEDYTHAGSALERKPRTYVHIYHVPSIYPKDCWSCSDHSAM